MKRGFVTLYDDSAAERGPRAVAAKCLDPVRSFKRFSRSLLGFFPIISWLPAYSPRSDLLGDLSSGVTVGVFLIPQGIAFSVLAGLHPVYGLYSAFFPILFYMFFGSCPYLSFGPAAIISLMIGVSTDRLLADPKNADFSRISIVRTLTFANALVQIITAALRLDFLISFVSDQLVDGFVCAACFHVLTSQLADILGYRTLAAKGFGSFFVRLYRIVSDITRVNLFTVGISVISAAVLIVGRDYCSPKKLPIPYEIIVIVLTTVASTIFDFSGSYGVGVVGEIPSGLPYPQLPEFSLLSECMSDAVGLAIVGISIHLSLGKVFAKKVKDREVDYCQELYALGFANALSSLFSCLPTHAGISKSLVAISCGIKTLLSNAFSALVVFLVIFWLGPYLENLPMCVLSTVVIVCLRPMFLKFIQLPKLLKTSKIDSSIWSFAFLSTLFTNVLTGFSLSFAFAVFTIVLRNQWPSWSAKTTKDGRICIFSFQAPILFSNCGKFKDNVLNTVRVWITDSNSTDHHLVFDFAGVTAIDTMGIGALKEIVSEAELKQINVYFLGTSDAVVKALNKAQFFKTIPEEFFVQDLDEVSALVQRTIEKGALKQRSTILEMSKF